LREPLNQVRHAAGYRATLEPIYNRVLNVHYQTAARNSFLGLPPTAARRRIVTNPSQWRYSERPERRLVIKEVNPYLADWLVHAHRPRLVYLLRHPAAVAVSFRQQGWLSESPMWREVGDRFGRAHAAAWQGLQSYADVMYADYDALCETPRDQFQRLFAFAGLTWNAATASHLEARITSSDDRPYGLNRVSQSMARNWVGKLTPAELAELKAGFLGHPTPWYQSESDW
jgi:hypothetical protein